MEEDDKNFDEELFFKCLQLSKVDEFIHKLPKEENTSIGELGSYLSGGQKTKTWYCKSDL